VTLGTGHLPLITIALKLKRRRSKVQKNDPWCLVYQLLLHAFMFLISIKRKRIPFFSITVFRASSVVVLYSPNLVVLCGNDDDDELSAAGPASRQATPPCIYPFKKKGERAAKYVAVRWKERAWRTKIFPTPRGNLHK